MRYLILIALLFVAYAVLMANGPEVYYWLFPEMKATAKPMPTLKHKTR